MTDLRRISIRSRYQDVECGACGATVTIDLDAPGGPATSDPDPYAHEDDCPRAELPDPRGTRRTETGADERAVVLAVAHTLADALYVLTLTPSTRRLLEVRDPMALEQARAALREYRTALGQEDPEARS